MYSLVLLMAMTGSSETPDFGRWGCGCNAYCGGYSCCGGYSYSHCGCYGWYRGGCGGCWGSYSSGCWGGYHGGWCGCYTPVYTCGCYSSVIVAPPMAPDQSMPKKVSANEAGPATIVVTLPSDAKLIVDDHMTTSMNAERRFTTPNLDPGKEYSYTFKAQIVRDGQTLQAHQKVPVRAGEEIRVSIDPGTFTVAVGTQ